MKIDTAIDRTIAAKLAEGSPATEEIIIGLRLQIERLRAALTEARQSILGHYAERCGDHCDDAVAKIDAALDDQQLTTTEKK